MAVEAYSTHDILMNLFKLALKVRNLPELADEAVIALDTQIAQFEHNINNSLDNGPMKDINAMKTLVMEAKDSPKRKELVGIISDLDSKLISPNAQGENLREETHKINNEFWIIVSTAGLKNQTPEANALNKIKETLKELESKIKPYTEKQQQYQEVVDGLAKQVEAMAGKTLSEIVQSNMVAPQNKP